MLELLYVTGNVAKLSTANKLCQPLGISLKQACLDIDEIQSEDGMVVARAKCQRAYDELRQPLIISDDSWLIPGLNDFPGPYMKSMNHWFAAEDWLHLVKPLQDRRIILRQVIVYQDIRGQHSFYADVNGVLLDEIRGRSIHPHTTICSLDNGMTSVAESIASTDSALAASQQPTSWHKFAEWYVSHPAKV